MYRFSDRQLVLIYRNHHSVSLYDRPYLLLDSGQFGRMQNGRILNGRGNVVESHRSKDQFGRVHSGRVSNLVECTVVECILGRVCNSVE